MLVQTLACTGRSLGSWARAGIPPAHASGGKGLPAIDDLQASRRQAAAA